MAEMRIQSGKRTRGLTSNEVLHTRFPDTEVANKRPKATMLNPEAKPFTPTSQTMARDPYPTPAPIASVLRRRIRCPRTRPYHNTTLFAPASRNVNTSRLRAERLGHLEPHPDLSRQVDSMYRTFDDSVARTPHSNRPVVVGPLEISAEQNLIQFGYQADVSTDMITNFGYYGSSSSDALVSDTFANEGFLEDAPSASRLLSSTNDIQHRYSEVARPRRAGVMLGKLLARNNIQGPDSELSKLKISFDRDPKAPDYTSMASSTPPKGNQSFLFQFLEELQHECVEWMDLTSRLALKSTCHRFDAVCQNYIVTELPVEDEPYPTPAPTPMWKKRPSTPQQDRALHLDMTQNRRHLNNNLAELVRRGNFFIRGPSHQDIRHGWILRFITSLTNLFARHPVNALHILWCDCCWHDIHDKSSYTSSNYRANIRCERDVGPDLKVTHGSYRTSDSEAHRGFRRCGRLLFWAEVWSVRYKGLEFRFSSRMPEKGGRHIPLRRWERPLGSDDIAG